MPHTSSAAGRALAVAASNAQEVLWVVRTALIAVTCLLIVVSFPHALEDFQYGDLMRLGIGLQLGIAILCTAYALQILGITLVLEGSSRGSLLLAALGAVWCLGATVIHGHDMMFAGPAYRHGAVSRLLEAAIIVLGGLAAVLGTIVTIRSGATLGDGRG